MRLRGLAIARRAMRLLPKQLKQDIKRAVGVPSMERSLLRLKHAGFVPSSALDIGAYRGEWTRIAQRVFPTIRVLMVEAQPDLAPTLERMAMTQPGIEVAIELLGREEKEAVPFHASGDWSRVLGTTGDGEAPTTMLPMTTLDGVAARHHNFTADLIKLDVQGSELEVLRGGQRTLGHAEVVVMEVNLMSIIPGAPLFDEVVVYMRARDFQLYDVAGFMERPYDRAIWQLDAVFVRRSSALLSSTVWDGVD